MDILFYLSERLQKHASVGITGLGTFSKRKIAGRYDKESKSFLPPGYVLQFTSEVGDEKQFEEFLADKKNTTKEGAANLISQFVQEINTKLETEHEVELENIGRLFFTEHEGLSFEPSENINYGSEFFGLPTIAEAEPDAVPNEKKSQHLKNEDGNPDEFTGSFEQIPSSAKKQDVVEHAFPVIENIELDEVKDDLKHTLSNSFPEKEKESETDKIDVPGSVKEQHEEHPNRFGHQPESEIPKTHDKPAEESSLSEEFIEAPEFIKAQHEEHPHRFGHQPESEIPKTLDKPAEELSLSEEFIEAPEFIKEQHEEHPYRFGHQPESEIPKTLDKPAEELSTYDEVIEAPEFIKAQHDERPHHFGHQPASEKPKKYINLEDETNVEPELTEAPEFIQEQHAGHPNRFGHDPKADEVFEENDGKSVWPKILTGLFILILTAIVIYFIKPDWFGRTQKVETPVSEKTVADTIKSDKVDTTKKLKDSIAKTDRILKANQVGAKTDAAGIKKNTTAATAAATSEPKSMFHVISVSYATEAAAQRYIDKVKKIGLNATIARMEGKRKKVSIASYPTREEAEKQKNILQKKLKGEGFYVKEIKNNTQP